MYFINKTKNILLYLKILTCAHLKNLGRCVKALR
ncbi:hypothetical protein SPX-vSaudiArabia_132 [Sheeppox virus]|uniref:Uncharacterized protein n=1 Tax=Sheeppox virus TaxID=10266 RepID=A0A5C0PTS1_SHEV|nr:hypothetical protein SPX-vSaudiArabia_132 [Sheeppox virus]